MKETVKGAALAFARKGKSIDPTITIMQICQEQWELDQKINLIANKVWTMNREKLSLCQQKVNLEKQKTELFVKMGLKHIKPVDKKAGEE